MTPIQVTKGAWLRCGVAIFAAAVVDRSVGQTITYADFSSTAGLSLNASPFGGLPYSDGSALVLTDASGLSVGGAGSVFTTATVNVASFSTKFQFQMSGSGEGLTFALQSTGSTAIGGGYSGLGFGNLTGIAVSFDINHDQGAPVDPSVQFVAVLSGHNLGPSYPVPLTYTDSLYSSLKDLTAGTWSAWVDYDGTTLSVRMSDTNIRPTSALLSYGINISSFVGGNSAYVGFTSADDGSFNPVLEEILNWGYEPTYNPGGFGAVAVPEPSSAAFLLALGGILPLGRRLFKRAR